MTALTLAARLVLAGVFAVAAVAKLADRDGFRQTLTDLAVPAALTAPLAALVPAVEVAIAAALIAPPTAHWGALAALGLLLCFCAALAVNLARGRTPPCRCFGALHATPTGAATLARTGALAILAGAIVALGHGDPHDTRLLAGLGPPSGHDALAIALALSPLAIIAAGAALFAALVAQNGRLLVRVEALERRLAPAPAPPGAATGDGLPIGTPAPAFTIADTDGGPLGLDDLRATGRPIVLLFSDPGCGPCRALAPHIDAWRREHAGRLAIVVLERRPDVARAYNAHATPTAVLIGADGTIASPPAVGARAITDLVRRATPAAASTDLAGAPPTVVNRESVSTLWPRT
jgi:hypothetical protein